MNAGLILPAFMNLNTYSNPFKISPYQGISCFGAPSKVISTFVGFPLWNFAEGFVYSQFIKNPLKTNSVVTKSARYKRR